MVNLDGATIVHRRSDLLAIALGGQLMLMPVDRGQHFGLGETAQGISDLLVEPQSLDSRRSQTTSYKSAEGGVEADVRRFIEEMEREALVELK